MSEEDLSDVQDLLPDDQELCERSSRWAQMFEKHQNDREDGDVRLVTYVELSGKSEDSDAQTEETVDPKEFEDNVTKEDPSFNIDDVLNATQKVIAKRKESWRQNGIDRLMDSFCCDQISGKVDGWLQNNCDYFSSNFSRDPKRHCFNEIKINERNIVVEKDFDDRLTDTSVDTAKYILSNRKRRKSKVTMTIKQFCYSAQRKRSPTPLKAYEKSKDGYNSHPKMLAYDLKSRSKKQSSVSPPKKVKTAKRQQRRPYFSTSSSSSSSEDTNLAEIKRSQKYCRKPYKLRRKRGGSNEYKKSCNGDILKKEKSKNNMKEEIVCLDSSDSSVSCNELQKRKASGLISEEKSGVSNGENAHAYDPGSNNCNSLEKAPSDLNLTKIGVINSTAIKSQDSMLFCKEKFVSACTNVNDSSNNQGQASNNNTIDSVLTTRRSSIKPIILYSPNLTGTPPSLLNKQKLKITQKDLESSVGSEMKKRFLGSRKNFHYECSAKSQLVFIPPSEANAISSSGEEEDPIGSANNGKIVEIVFLDDEAS
ncbi:unnamed protein product [Hermetia illucens]|uniref:Uncharacterized protein n=1 Tax=Hermetia illucens TaxID=343691 RepID=A0A7R8UPB9_HERIL|nr:uncharacterized protein LOC119652993 [Hermetia illucens]CAD7084431.1 unnamed protein product [Hermetia illucens]